MAGEHPAKHDFEDANVYVHETGEAGGVLIGLKDEMLERTEAYLGGYSTPSIVDYR